MFYTHVETKRYNSCSEKSKSLLLVHCTFKKIVKFQHRIMKFQRCGIKMIYNILLHQKYCCFFLRDLSLTFLSLGPAQNTSPHWFSGLGFLIHLMHPLLPVLLWKFHTPLMHNPSAKLWKKKYFIQKQEVSESSHSPYFLNTMYKSQNI